MLRLLVQAGANMDACTAKGPPALAYALACTKLEAQDLEIVQILIGEVVCCLSSKRMSQHYCLVVNPQVPLQTLFYVSKS
jgi:hypothetical protein